ncbi:NAD(+) synthase [Christiangramia fulva]|uniref:Glutamine-dependent NAD(+) synthetase n=1 Tax=Christiangramia fulva TaxID=2126553 RepID=A0A2R3Z7H8_9FLAO|nr:NAD(+) synthase [Christiangramia fulva]AVR46236.1 NAD(+) synthase [Christiangramia fulva]
MSSQKLKIAACQMKVVPGHPDINTKKIITCIREAKENGDDIIIFPEMAIPGYLLSDEWENEAFLVDCLSYNEDIVHASGDIMVVWGNVDIDKNHPGEDGRIRRFNTAFVAQNGEMIGKFYKTLHPDYREFDDDRYFYSARKLAQDEKIPIKDFLQPLQTEINGKHRKIGITLCEDMWSQDYSISPIDLILENGAEFIINISCSPWTWRKNNKRHQVVREHLKNHPVPFIYVNNIGIQNNGKNIFLFEGNTTFYHPDGSLYKIAKSYEECSLRGSIFSEEKEVHENPLLSKKIDHEELLQGLLYGIKNFFKSIKAEKVVIGLSGGVDSSLSAYLLAKALGPDRVFGVNMPSQYNSEITKDIARKLAEKLGIYYAIIPIQEAYDFTEKQLESTQFESLDGSEDKINLELDTLDKENIQARDRGGRVLAGIASALNAVFVNNGNKSETAIGYATLYGDINGALAPIADLYKNEIYSLCRHINEIEEKPIFPKKLFEIPPSAELSAEQNIEEGKGDPLYFPYHDKLFRAFIEFRLDPEDILEMYIDGSLLEKLKIEEGVIETYFENNEKLILDLEDKWRKFKISYFKRIQAPPIIAVSRRAFGFDLRESQNGVHFTRRYQKLKKRLLKID